MLHAIGIVLVALILFTAVMMVADHAIKQTYRDRPWAHRIHVWRDQLLTLIALNAISEVCFATNLALVGKLAACTLYAVFIYFVWENILAHCSLTQSAKQYVLLARNVLIALVVASLFL